MSSSWWSRGALPARRAVSRLRAAAIALAVAAASVALGLPDAAQAAQENVIASVSAAGLPGNDDSGGGLLVPAISSNRRYVAFASKASNLAAGDLNGSFDVFVRDLAGRDTRLVSVRDPRVGSSPSLTGNGDSLHLSLSADGRFVAFDSEASDLVAGDTNGASDVFVRDMLLGQTTRVSLAPGGVQASGDSTDPSISSDGRFVAFTSSASDLVSLDTNGAQDVFVTDRLAGSTLRVSVNDRGDQGDGGSSSPAIAATSGGRFVAFESFATNLACKRGFGGSIVSCAEDGNGKQDVFVHDAEQGTTRRVSMGAAGEPANDSSQHPTISGDGFVIAYESKATNIVAGANGRSQIYAQRAIVGTTLESRGSGGAPGLDGDSTLPSLSGNGGVIAFQSNASNLVPDAQRRTHAFVKNVGHGTTFRMSVGPGGVPADGDSGALTASPDGQVVAFASAASNLVPADLNGVVSDIFVHYGALPTCPQDRTEGGPVSRAIHDNLEPLLPGGSLFDLLATTLHHTNCNEVGGRGL